MGGEICPKMEYNSSLQISKEMHLDTFSGFFDYQISKILYIFKIHSRSLSSMQSWYYIDDYWRYHVEDFEPAKFLICLNYITIFLNKYAYSIQIGSENSGLYCVKQER